VVRSPQIEGGAPCFSPLSRPQREGEKPARLGSFGARAAEVSLLLPQAGYLLWGRAAETGEPGLWAGRGGDPLVAPQDGVTVLVPFVFPSSATCVPPSQP